MNDEEGLIKRESLPVMVNTYNEAVKLIHETFAKMLEMENLLKEVYLDEYMRIGVRSRSSTDWKDPKEYIDYLTSRCWRAIIDRSEIKRYLTEKRADILEKQIEDNKMPELTETNVWEVLQSGIANLRTFTNEMITETWNLLRPSRIYGEYKTNQKFQNEIGEWAILHNTLDVSYSEKTRFHVRYGRSENNLRQIQNAFAILDGKGVAGGYYGELIESIKSSPEGKGETEYFIWKGYQNRNLHLKFKRMDLVKRMNAIVGGNGITSKGA